MAVYINCTNFFNMLHGLASSRDMFLWRNWKINISQRPLREFGSELIRQICKIVKDIQISFVSCLFAMLLTLVGKLQTCRFCWDFLSLKYGELIELS